VILEKTFEKRVRKWLDSLSGCFHFKKVGESVRAYPDLICCINGTFVGLEVKRSAAEANKQTGRTVLQRKVLADIRKAGGYAEFVYPENFQLIKESILLFTDR